MNRKIGILTSGGDAPGMNDVIRAAVYFGINKGFEMYGIIDGYKGLVEGKIKRLTKADVDQIETRGGTILRTARLPEFKNLEVQKKGAENLKNLGIDALLVVGGDGSYMGAKALSDLGICCVTLPGTIDNDISSSDITIGFDTALNTIVNAIDQIKDTGRSHERCMVVEVMGNHCDDLALYAGIANCADIVISRNHMVSKEDVVKELQTKKDAGQEFALVVVSEKIIDLNELIKYIQENATWDTRGTVLGHIQRGGTPTAMERVNAVRMTNYAIDLIEKNISSVCIGIKDGEVVHQDIIEALKSKSKSSAELIKIIDEMK